MRLESILLHPAAPYVALSIGMSLCLCLFASLKRELRAHDRRLAEKVDALEADFNGKTAILDERWAELSHVSTCLVPPPPVRSGMNLARRAQALQMLKRGESAQETAAVLSLPLNEVDLLVKVQR